MSFPWLTKTCWGRLLSQYFMHKVDLYALKKKRSNIKINSFIQRFVVLFFLGGSPSILKIPRICPAYKSGQSDLIDNYRPISSLPVFSKIFERLTLDRKQCFISRLDILTPCQFGFRKGKNTSLAVIKLISHVVRPYHQKKI